MPPVDQRSRSRSHDHPLEEPDSVKDKIFREKARILLKIDEIAVR
jgi:hypothetical protein